MPARAARPARGLLLLRLSDLRRNTEELTGAPHGDARALFLAVCVRPAVS